MNMDEKYRKAGEIISTAGGTPLPVNDTLIKLLKFFILEDEVDFIAAFKDKKSQTMEQLKLSSGLSEEEIHKKVKALAGRGWCSARGRSCSALLLAHKAPVAHQTILDRHTKW